MKKQKLSIHSSIVKEKVDAYVFNNCPLGKATLLAEIIDLTGMYYIDLEEYLFEEKRTLIRINMLNKLIPELKKMLIDKKINKVLAYELATKSVKEQIDYYKMMKGYMKLKADRNLEFCTKNSTNMQLVKRKSSIKSKSKVSFSEYKKIEKIMKHRKISALA